MNWINVFGLFIVIFMLIPNIIYACQNKDLVNKCTSRLINTLEQVGRYGSMFLMVCNLGIFEFGFRSKNGFAVWLVSVVVLLVAYWVFWLLYAKKPVMSLALLLAILPSIIFVLSGVMLRHWLLVGFGLVFSCAHIFITYKNHRAA